MPTVEERLAALETKLAALTETTPTTYYEHQYSGEEIDAAVGRALTGGALDTSVTNVSNQLGTFTRPNLLDNWYFGRPVNQRGKTSYSENGYTIDRWNNGATVSIENGFIRVASTGQYSQIFQTIESEFAGKTFSLSFLVRGTPGAQCRTLAYDYEKSVAYGMEAFHTFTSSNFEMLTVSGVFSSSTPSKLTFIFYPNNADTKLSVDILAAKLELGPTQTLAHREGDKWVLNEVPDYGEQMRRCQRYARSLRGNSKSGYCQLATGVATSATDAILYVPLGQPLRTGPIITSTGNFRIVAKGGTVIKGVAKFNFSLGELSESIVRFAVSVNGGLTAGDFVVLQPDNDSNADILLSADL